MYESVKINPTTSLVNIYSCDKCVVQFMRFFHLHRRLSIRISPKINCQKISKIIGASLKIKPTASLETFLVATSDRCVPCNL